jgi:general stress protein 26
MSQATEKPDIERLYQLLQKAESASLSTTKGQEMHARFLKFACDEKLKAFYFLTARDKDKIKEIKNYPGCVMSVELGGRDDEDSMDITVKGNIRILTDYKAHETQAGFKALKERSKFAKFLFESGNMGEYMMLKVVPEEIIVHKYRDIVNNIPGTTDMTDATGIKTEV